ncbi:MAG: glycosyltransferase family 2 protein [Chryseolinea sp.]
MKPPFVSIIIVNFNSRDFLHQCLVSVYQHTKDVGFEIIVVDNSVADGVETMLQDNFPAVTYLSNPQNDGFGAANNKGLALGHGDMIFFLNPDTVLTNNAVKCLADYLHHHQEVGACGGALLNDDLTPQISFGRFPTVTSLFFEFLFRKLFPTYYNNHLAMEGYVSGAKPFPVQYITGADMLVRRDVLAQVGAFDLDFFLFFEETELCHRIGRAGYEQMIVPDARIIHLCGKSTAQAASRKKVEWFEHSRLLFLTKTRGRLYARIYRHCALWLCRLAVVLKGNADHWLFRRDALMSFKYDKS